MRKKREKPFSLKMPFGEAMKRIVKVKPSKKKKG